MNISYHYYTMKVLAAKAGFDEEEAQVIAYYSQMVDDFVLSHRLVVGETPPSFFIENGLAQELGDHMWGFLPCPTGIDFVKTISHGYQRLTMAPFHFIPPRKLEEIEKRPGFSRLDYRCVCAGQDDNLLIHEIAGEAAREAAGGRTVKNLMRLGMALHTYADTYAHCHFSGFHGYENEAAIQKAYNKEKGAEAVPGPERLLLRELPSIGHANVGTAPDICSYDIVYMIKSSEDSGLDQKVERDNTESFSECSRRILDLLCGITKRPLYSDRQWEKLRAALVKAQYVKKDSPQLLTESFGRIFPDIVFAYDKNSRLSIKLRVEGNVAEGGEEDWGMVNMGDMQDMAQEELMDAFSPQGNRRRSMCCTFLEEPGEEFFLYNELAYERTKLVAGQYVSERTRDTFTELCCLDFQNLNGGGENMEQKMTETGTGG